MKANRISNRIGNRVSNGSGNRGDHRRTIFTLARQEHAERGLKLILN